MTNNFEAAVISRLDAIIQLLAAGAGAAPTPAAAPAAVAGPPCACACQCGRPTKARRDGSFFPTCYQCGARPGPTCTAAPAPAPVGYAPPVVTPYAPQQAPSAPVAHATPIPATTTPSGLTDAQAALRARYPERY